MWGPRSAPGQATTPGATVVPRDEAPWHRTARAAKNEAQAVRDVAERSLEQTWKSSAGWSAFSGHRQGVGMLGPISGQRLQASVVPTPTRWKSRVLK